MRFPIIGDLVDWIISNDAAAANAENQQRLMDEYRSVRPVSFSQDQFNPSLTSIPNDIRYQLTQEDPALRQKQVENLNNLQALSNGKINAQRDLDRYKAIQDANSIAQARDQSALQQAQARGVGGGGLEFALRQQGGQDAANRAQQADLSSAAQAALERLQASGQLQSGLSSLRGQDYQVNNDNNNIINKFNTLNSTRNQEALDKQAVLKNQAQQYNMDRNDRNSLLRNKSQNDITYKTLDFANPSQQQQLKMKYQPLYRFNDAFSNTMGDLVASGIGGGEGGSIGGGGGSGMWSNIGSLIGSKAATGAVNNKSQSSDEYDDLMDWGF